MHILMGILSALGIIGILIWRAHLAAEAAREIIGLAGDAKNLARRASWRRKLNRPIFDRIEDAREAAIIMMVAVAEDDGPLQLEEAAQIAHNGVKYLGMSEPLAGEFIAQARFMLREPGDLGARLRRLQPIIQRNCSADEKYELIDMLNSVAGHGTTSTSTTHHEIARLADRIGARR